LRCSYRAMVSSVAGYAEWHSFEAYSATALTRNRFA
jgi:hypothetical protein